MEFEGSFKNRDAQNIVYRAFIPERPKAVVVLAHGLGEHLLKYAYFGERLSARGVAAFFYDQRGHGRSQGTRVYAKDFNDFAGDLGQAIEIAKVETLCEKAFIVGLSMGGLLALDFAIKNGSAVDGIALSAPALKLKSPPSGIEADIVNAVAALFPRLSTTNRIPFEWLSHDAAMVDEIRADRYSQRQITVGLYVEMVKAMRFVSENIAGLKVPLLFLQGTGDNVVDAGGVKAVFERAGSPDKELKLFDGMYHELLRETRRDEVMDRIIDWTLKRAGER